MTSDLSENHTRTGGPASVDGVWERHVDIERAKGALIAIFGIDAEEAFTVLSEQSQKRNIKLFVLAATIMADFGKSRPAEYPVDTARDALNRMFDTPATTCESNR